MTKKQKLDSCPSCHHPWAWRSFGWGGSRTGCSEETSSGPCNSDYSYCECKHEFHWITRCTFVNKNINKQNYIYRGRDYDQNGRCTIESYLMTPNMECEKHISPLDKAQIDLLMANKKTKVEAIRNKKELDFKIKEAKNLLKENGYKIVKT